MSRFDSNPFDAEGEHNPFADGGTSGARKASYENRASFGVSSGGEGRTVASSFEANDVQFSPRTLKKKQQELQARQNQLLKKETDLDKREQALGIQTKNWPPFFPIIRNNIAEDCPEHTQSIMYFGYYTWLGALISLTYNILPITAAWIAGAFSAVPGFGNFFMALIYLIVGVPGSYFFWYMRLYYAMRKDSSVGMAFFLCGFFSHLIFFTFAAVSPPFTIVHVFSGASLSGVYYTISALTGGWLVVGIFYAIGAFFWVSTTVASYILLFRVYAYFRGRGPNAQLRADAAAAAAAGDGSNPV